MSKRQRHLLVLLLYSLLAIIMTWPLAAQLGTSLPGEVEIADSYVHYWTFNWLKNALLTGQNSFDTALIFYPNSISLLNHNLAWINFAAWLPLQALLGNAAAYSLTFIAIFIFNGYTTYLLATELLAPLSRLPTLMPAFLAGLIAAFWPYNLSHPDHPNLILSGWLALALLHLHRLFVHHRHRDALLAGLFIALLGLTRWQLLLMAAPLLGLYVIVKLLRNRAWSTTVLLKQLLLTGLAAIILMAPFLAPLLVYQLGRPDPTNLLVTEEAYGTDLLAYLVPGRYHPWWGEAMTSQYNRFQGNNLYSRAIGYTVMLLLVYGLITCWRQSRLWLLVLLLYLLLALGSNLTVNGVTLWPLPYSLLDNWFLLRLLRYPDRFNVILALPVAILAGIAAQHLLAHRSTWLAALLAGFILIEYAVTLPTLPLTAPAWYSQLAEEPGDFAILALPTHTRLQFNKHYMAYQLVHGKALVEGRIARPPREAYAFMNSVPLLQHALDSNDPPFEHGDIGHQLRLLAAADVRYVVLHKQFLSVGELAAWREWFNLPPFYEDEEVVVMNTAVSLPPFVHVLTPQIGLITSSTLPEQVQAGDWLSLTAYWGSTATAATATDLCFNLVAAENISLGCQPLSPVWPSERWQVNELVRAEYTVQVSPFVTGGSYALQLNLAQAGTAVGHPATIGHLSITGLARTFTPPTPQQITDITWDNTFHLIGSDLTTTAAALNLTFYWQAQQRPSVSYKLFVHVVERGTAEIVAQADLIPGNWTYPTNWWEAGEFVSETLAFSDLPPGDYELWLGWYEPDSGQRLLTESGEDRVLLTTVTIFNSPGG